MEINLTIGERLTLISTLPKEGNFLTMKALKKLSEELSPTEEESKYYEIQFVQNGIKFDKEKSKEEKPFNIDQTSFKAIKETLEKLDKTNKLNSDQITLFEKFDIKFEESS